MSRTARILVLMAAAAALDFLPITGPGGIALLLGPFVYMPLVLVANPGWAVAAAAAAYLPTLWWLGHPFLIVVVGLEALWLSTSRTWTTRHAALTDLAFWLVAGMPLLLWFDLAAANLPRPFALIIVTKLAVNQLGAVVTAHFLARDTQLGHWIEARTARRERLRDLVFDYVFALALVPLFLLGAGMSVMLRRLAEDGDRQVLAESAQRVAQQADLFFRSHGAALQTAAKLASRTPADHEAILQAVRHAYPAFITMLMTDREGAVTATSPAASLPALARTSVADREYFATARRDGRTNISHVFRGRGFGTDILVAVSAPWLDPAGQFGGVVEGSLEVEHFGRSVVQASALRGVALVVADPGGRVIYADPATGLRPLAHLRHDPLGALLKAHPGERYTFERYGADGERNFYVGEAVRSPEFGIVVIAERPLLAALANVSWIYALFAVVMAGIVAGAILVARAAARRLSRPLETFAQGTTALAERNSVEPLPPVDGPTADEFTLVFSAFNRLAARLQASYAALRRQNTELDRRVAERTRELEQARQAAEEANQSKTDFLAMTSHEIRTPLNAIIGLADAMDEEPIGPAAKERLRTISGAGNHLLTVVNDLIDLSRIEAGKLEVVPAPVDLGALCREVRALLALRAGQQGIALRLAFEPSEPFWVRTDAGRLRQVLVNLAGNAIKFTTEGEVCLRIEQTGVAGRDAVQFSIIDTGPGITPEEQSRLFQPYVQLENARRSGTVGSGLGLAISRRLVDLLGGSLQLRSRPGAGSTFFFSLPLPRIDPPAPAPATEPAIVPARTALRALVADDNFANQEVMRAYLEPLGAAVTVVATAADAIASLTTAAFDVAFIDLEMPDGDGFSVAAAVRDRQARQPDGDVRCQLVAFSAHARDEVIERCLENGFVDFLGKPFARQDLLRIIAETRSRTGVPA
ncbi:MAG TPA: ATP-binding protein [Opitutaceae bacterium]|nr:ATP-binding protein [Opitutaceae bacterium]